MDNYCLVLQKSVFSDVCVQVNKMLPSEPREKTLECYPCDYQLISFVFFSTNTTNGVRNTKCYDGCFTAGRQNPYVTVNKPSDKVRGEVCSNPV